MRLTGDLYWRCRKVFLKCREFYSYENLCAFCNAQEEFSFFKEELVKVDNQGDLFTRNLPIFLEAEHTKYGFIFPIFVDSLMRGINPENARWNELNEFYLDIQRIYSDSQRTISCQPLNSQVKQQLFNSIIDIDFDDQEEKVIKALNVPSLSKYHHKTAAFLVHGKEKFGQETLVNRLLQLQKLNNGRRIKIKASNMTDMSELWYEVGKYFMLKSQTCLLSGETVIDKVFECLSTQNLIFIFYEIHRTYIGFLEELIQDFWQPIVERANNKETYLVMFLIDSKGKVCQSGVPLAEELNDPLYPKIPLRLPPATEFPPTKLEKWLRIAVRDNLVPESVCVETLLEESQGGVPELVYQRICFYCGFNWEGKLA